MTAPAGSEQWAAYALVTSGGRVLLTRRGAPQPGGPTVPWRLPGRAVGPGEDPLAVATGEARERSGIAVTLGPSARIRPAHAHGRGPAGRALVYEGWVAKDADLRAVEHGPGGGPDVEVAWPEVTALLDGERPVEPTALSALADLAPARVQRLGAYALVRRPGPEPAILLTQVSARGHHSGCWTLPGGGVGHGESPRAAAAREVREETGLEVQVGALLEVDDLRVRGTAPSGRVEGFHGIHLVFEATAPDLAARPRVCEVDGTTGAVAWVPEREVGGADRPVLDVVPVALAAARRAGAGR